MKRESRDFRFETLIGIVALVVSISVVLSKADSSTLIFVAAVGVLATLLIQIYQLFK